VISDKIEETTEVQMTRIEVFGLFHLTSLESPKTKVTHTLHIKCPALSHPFRNFGNRRKDGNENKLFE
jgi:preprotein translocase subunit SecB